MKKRYWIKERHNPQLGRYYVPMGQLTNMESMKHEKTTPYGTNIMLPYDSERAYLDAIAVLKKTGESIQ